MVPFLHPDHLVRVNGYRIAHQVLSLFANHDVRRRLSCKRQRSSPIVFPCPRQNGQKPPKLDALPGISGRAWSRSIASAVGASGPGPRTKTQLKAHFKRRLPLHSQTVQALIEKFCATIDGVRTKHQSGDKHARYPRFFNPIFKGQALKIGVRVVTDRKVQ